jgi:hypothetical protein
LGILERNLFRGREEHVGALLAVLTEALSVIHPQRRATVSECLKLFNDKTFGALQDYVAQVRSTTLSVIEDSQVCFTSSDKYAVLAIVEKFVEPSLYIARFAAFEGAIGRHLARFGSLIQLNDFRPDINKASYQAGTSNINRRFLAALSDDLEMVAQKQKNISTPATSTPEGKWEQANRLVKLEPNIFGIGINFPYLIRRWLKRRN